jgi:anti-sigma-K factor RskA
MGESPKVKSVKEREDQPGLYHRQVRFGRSGRIATQSLVFRKNVDMQGSGDSSTWRTSYALTVMIITLALMLSAFARAQRRDQPEFMLASDEAVRLSFSRTI